MRKNFTLLLFFLSFFAFSQQEASVWYFGAFAGLKFNTDGSVTPLSNGQINTNEGCSTIADFNGNLLFYTDGRTVWDRNHIIMPNGDYFSGTGLYGDPSSTQSGIIVPKPGNPDVYYIFTVDEPHHLNATTYPNAFPGPYNPEGGVIPTADDGRNNGFNYTEVDLSLTGSNGSVGDISTTITHLITYDLNPSGEEIKFKCSEKITAVRNFVANEYWVITHFLDKFYAFRITASGVVSTPVVSQIGPLIPTSGYRRNSIGYLKASPDGTKIAIAHEEAGTVAGGTSFGTGMVRLYDFDLNTGIISSEVPVVSNVSPYGIEFSSDSKKLYATYRNQFDSSMALAQYDLEAADVAASQVKVFEDFVNLYALQLAPNGKIYCAIPNQTSLGVINNPEALGVACNYDPIGQTLSSGRFSTLGLPPFITSFFNAAFTMQYFCLGAQTAFEITNTQNVVSVFWDFGDGFTSTDFNPMHTYASPGLYNVTLTATTPTDVSSASREVMIYEVPVANAIPDRDVCSANATASVSLLNAGTTAIGAQTGTFDVAYFASMQDATSNTNPLATMATFPVGATEIFVKVFNTGNPACYDIASFMVNVYRQPIANTPTAYLICDDSSNDGLEIFDLQSKIIEVLGTQNAAAYSVSFHPSQAEADLNSNALALNYQNTTNPQTIFVRIQNNAMPDCFETTQFQITVSQLPVANPLPILEICDEGNDGEETFDLTSQNVAALLGQSSANFDVTYHLTSQEAILDTSYLPANYTNSINPQTIYVRVTNKSNRTCFDTTSFTINAVPKPELDLPSVLPLCEGTSMTLSAPAGFDTYLWSTGETTSDIIVSQPDTYTVTTGFVYSTVTCETSATIEVENSNVATFTGIDIHDWTDNHNTISIFVTGDGDYEYSLDGFNYQTSNEFSGLIPGEYTVYVNDANGCGLVTDTVYLLMYPKFFTPNGDAQNDYWQIKASQSEPDLEVLIFDRYGKIVTSIHANDKGWDGTYNGKQLPSTDYWFVAKRQNGREYRGHFSLKR
ncbi:MAG: T9SS type B sorting domain-containing protein [Flavobacterium sp.]|uniref:T9SS type B sorting domain-containing protein n=1 Tax=Flavobacterium sp. TaxID=239 RepID=UPI001220A036|nr:T9SS type B sorting domain-containing protein [Flavobacterium sp.]RZJ66851.1 MAG: T9SS type B sorting domain-containing protein [Flavobacterium sp.]